jgi:hemerythrin HHE cation binding domain-containing protein
MHDLLEILTHDQHELMDMFGALTAARDAGERRRILDEVTVLFAWYSAVEETHLYPAVRRALPDGDRIADKGLSDHAEAVRLLTELYEASQAGRGVEPLARRLIGEMNEHMDEETGAVFPRLAARLGRDDLRRLGAQVEAAMDDAARLPDVPVPPPVPTDPPHRRPRTPRDPAANERSALWPDPWAEHRCW